MSKVWQVVGALVVVYVISVGFAATMESIAQATANRQERAAFDAERAESARERKALLEGQKRLERQVDDLAEQNEGLIAYMSELGYAVPRSLIERRTTTRTVERDSDGGDDSEASEPRTSTAPRPTPRPRDEGEGGDNGSKPDRSSPPSHARAGGEGDGRGKEDRRRPD